MIVLTHETKSLNRNSKNFDSKLEELLNNGWKIDIDYGSRRLLLKREIESK